MSGRSVIYLRRGGKKRHIFTKEGTFWVAICDIKIIFRNTHPGAIKDVDCKNCQRLYDPKKHLYI